jgi:hypothetical protein
MISTKYARFLIAGVAVAGLFAFGRGGGNFLLQTSPDSPRAPAIERSGIRARWKCPFRDGWIKKTFAAPIRTICGPRGGFDIIGTDSTVVSASDGKVQATFNVGDVKAIMIRNGRFFYTYSNLDTLFLKKGDTVKAGDILGPSQMNDVDFVVTDTKGRYEDKIASDIDCKCLVVDYQLTAPADTSLEARALDKVFHVKEVQEKDRWIDSISGHRDMISLMVASRPTVAASWFLIQAGYYRDEKFKSFYDIYVIVKGRTLIETVRVDSLYK